MILNSDWLTIGNGVSSIMSTESKTCESCMRTSVSLVLSTCPYCLKKFCSDCIDKHLQWEKRHEGLSLEVEAAYGSSDISSERSSQASELNRKRHGMSWKLRCETCGEVSIYVRECPHCLRRFCTVDLEKHRKEYTNATQAT